MNFKKVVALSICAAMVAGMSMSTVMAADLPDQFKDLKANEAYEFPMMVKSFQSTYWDAAQEGMKKAAEELGVTYTPQGPNSESDIADQVNMINTAIASNPVGLGLAACDTSSVTDALTDAQKAQVSNYEALQKAEEKLAELKEDVAKVKDVESKIDAIGTDITLESKGAIAEARAAYDALTDAQKAQVSNYEALQKAEEEFASLTAYGTGIYTVDGEDVYYLNGRKEL